jgi:hypothetical protein
MKIERGMPDAYDPVTVYSYYMFVSCSLDYQISVYETRADASDRLCTLLASWPRALMA